jgi:hypothetical protein
VANSNQAACDIKLVSFDQFKADQYKNPNHQVCSCNTGHDSFVKLLFQYCYSLVFLAVLEFELRASHLLGRHSAT